MIVELPVTCCSALSRHIPVNLAFTVSAQPAAAPPFSDMALARAATASAIRHSMLMGAINHWTEAGCAAMMRIEAARGVFFPDAGDALGNYHERQDEKRSIGLGPEHDWSSYAADAFGYMAISYEEPPVKNASRSNRRSAELLRGTHWSM
jgi:hypothetical protein